jgi:hypothetical protein
VLAVNGSIPWVLDELDAPPLLATFGTTPKPCSTW